MAQNENLQQNSPEVVEWARSIGASKPKKTILENQQTDQEGLYLRVVKGTDISGIDEETILDLDLITREAVYIDKLNRERSPIVREAWESLVERFPGLRGTSSDPDHDNYNAAAVPQRKIERDNERIKSSLGENASLVFQEHNEIVLSFVGRLETALGSLDVDQVANLLRHSLLGVNVSEEFLNTSFVQRQVEKANDSALAQLILEGIPVGGFTVNKEWRLEIDAVERHKKITVKRPPVRKNLIRRAP